MGDKIKNENSDPAKYDDLTYSPVYGTVDVRGYQSEWAVRVSIKQGRAMEKDEIKVTWIYGSIPVTVVDFGLQKIWLFLYRLGTWPSRIGK